MCIRFAGHDVRPTNAVTVDSIRQTSGQTCLREDAEGKAVHSLYITSLRTTIGSAVGLDAPPKKAFGVQNVPPVAFALRLLAKRNSHIYCTFTNGSEVQSLNLKLSSNISLRITVNMQADQSKSLQLENHNAGE